MTLSIKALTKLTTVNRRLGLQTGEDVDRDMILEELIEEVSADFVAACGRQCFSKSGHLERVKGYGDHLLFLVDHVPLQSIDSIVYDDGTTQTTVESAYYEIEDATKGIIRRIGGTWPYTGNYHIGPRINRRYGSEQALIKVTYDGGWVTPQQAHLEDTERTLPRDIEAAVITKVVHDFRNRDRDQSVVLKKLGNATIQWANANAGEMNPMEQKWRKIIARYKMGGFR